MLENQQKLLTNNLQNNSKLGTFLSCLILLLIFSSPALAVENSTGILRIVNTGLSSWIPTIKTACLWVFFALAVIDWVWTFGIMALRGFELGEFLATLIKKIMYIGIFIFLFNVDSWLNIMMSSFTQLATNVSGQTISPNNIISSAVDILKAIWDGTGWNIPKTIFLLIVGLLILFAFTMMAIDLLLVYVKFYLMNIVIFFALALGGLTHFKNIGLNPILTAVKVGIELFMIQALMALAIVSIQNSVTEIQTSVTIDLVLEILIFAFIFSVITKLIPTVIEAVFQGTIGDSGAASAGFKGVMAMAAGMGVGAVAGAVGTTRAMNAARDLHFEQGGKGGMDLVKGVAKNLASAGSEYLAENSTNARMSNSIANSLEKGTSKLQKEKANEAKKMNKAEGSMGGESYHSGVGEG